MGILCIYCEWRWLSNTINSSPSNLTCTIKNLCRHGAHFVVIGGTGGCHFVNLWASCKIREIAGCACAGNAGNVSPPPRVSDPDMHHGTCVTHVPWCMPGSLTNGFIWSRWRGKSSRNSRCMRNPHLYVSGKRPMGPPMSTKLASYDSRFITVGVREPYHYLIQFRRIKISSLWQKWNIPIMLHIYLWNCIATSLIEREKELNVYRWQKWMGIHICMRNTWGFQKKAAIYCTDK